MIYSPVTEYFAQRAYDQMKRDFPADSPGTVSDRDMFNFATMQVANVLAHVALPATLTSMANPAKMALAGSGAYAWRHETSQAFRMGAKVAGKTGGRIATRMIPGIGWAMLAHDVYDLAFNRRFFGIDL